MRYRAICVLAIATMASVLSFGAPASEVKWPVQACTADNCNAIALPGRINRSDRTGYAALSMPWVAQVYAGKNECLRLHVVSQVTNTSLVAVAPGTQRAWRNDNSGTAPCPTCPLLKIKTGPDELGWFMVQVSQNEGAALNAEFVLKYSRYAATNPNCNNASAALPSP